MKYKIKTYGLKTSKSITLDVFSIEDSKHSLVGSLTYMKETAKAYYDIKVPEKTEVVKILLFLELSDILTQKGLTYQDVSGKVMYS